MTEGTDERKSGLLQRVAWGAAIGAGMLLSGFVAFKSSYTPPRRIVATFPAVPSVSTQPASQPVAVSENPAVVYRGLVADPEGRPAPNVPFRVYHVGVTSPQTPAESEGHTGADGTFAVGPFAREDNGRVNRVVMFDAPGFAWAWWNVGSGNPMTDDNRFRIALQPTLPVAGIITDDKGNAVAHAVVEADVQTINGNSYGDAQFTEQNKWAVLTDDRGAFRFNRMPEGALLHLFSRHEEHGPASTRVGVPQNRFYPVPAGMTDVAIQLPPPATVHAQLVQGGKSLGVAGVWVEAVDRNHVHRPVWEQSDAKGKLEFRGLGEGRWDLMAPALTTPDGAIAVRRVSVQLNANDNRPLNIPCELGEIVHGLLKDAESHQPLSEPMQVNLITPLGPTAVHTHSDSAGQFSFRLPLGPARISVRSWQEGRYRDVTQNVDVRPNVPLVEMEARARPFVHGQLTDAAGRPVEGMVVIGERYREQDCVFTRPDGRFTVPAPENNNVGHVGLALSNAHNLGIGFTFTTADEAQPLQLFLEPLATFTGQFIDDKGRPVAANVHTGLSFRFPRGTMVVDESVWKTDVRPDGKFRLGPVPAGYRLQLYTEYAGQERYRRIMYYDGGQTLDLGQVRVHSGDASISAAPRDASVTGTLADEAGKPVVGLEITTGQSEIPTTVTDLKGRFAMKKLPRNEQVWVMAYADNYGTNQWSVDTGKQNAQLVMTPLGTERVGKRATDFVTAKWLTQGSDKIADYAGKVVLLQTGAWIQSFPPNQSGPMRVYSKYKDKGLVLVTISQAWGINRVQDIQNWVDQNKVNWPAAIDATDDKAPAGVDRFNEGATASAYASHHQANLMYLIDKKGVVRVCLSGPDKDLEGWVQRLLAE